MTWAAIAILGFVTLQRLVELGLANRNTRRLLAEGAVEHSPGHYPFIVGLHTMWLGALWWWAPGRDINLLLLALFALLQLGRVWVIATLGSRWTTRVIVQPGAPRLRSGPFRYLDHPNYAIVAAEIAVLPLVFGLVGIAVAFSLLNAIILWVRIRAENKALESLRQ